MKTLDLTTLGVEEMDEKVLSEVDGGWWIGPSVMLSIYLWDNRTDFMDGFLNR